MSSLNNDDEQILDYEETESNHELDKTEGDGKHLVSPLELLDQLKHKIRKMKLTSQQKLGLEDKLDTIIKAISLELEEHNEDLNILINNNTSNEGLLRVIKSYFEDNIDLLELPQHIKILVDQNKEFSKVLDKMNVNSLDTLCSFVSKLGTDNHSIRQENEDLREEIIRIRGVYENKIRNLETQLNSSNDLHFQALPKQNKMANAATQIGPGSLNTINSEHLNIFKESQSINLPENWSNSRKTLENRPSNLCSGLQGTNLNHSINNMNVMSGNLNSGLTDISMQCLAETVSTIKSIASQMNAPLPPLKAFTGDKDTLTFSEFIAQFKLRYGLYADDQKIQTLGLFIEGSAKFLYKCIDKNTTFDAFVINLKSKVVDNSKVAQMHKLSDLDKIRKRAADSWVQFLAYIEFRVQKAFESSRKLGRERELDMDETELDMEIKGSTFNQMLGRTEFNMAIDLVNQEGRLIPQNLARTSNMIAEFIKEASTGLSINLATKKQKFDYAQASISQQPSSSTWQQQSSTSTQHPSTKRQFMEKKQFVGPIKKRKF